MAAQEQIYQPRVAPGNTPGMANAGADAFGAGVGEGMAQIGAALGRKEDAARKFEADTQAADFNAKFAALRVDTDGKSREMRENALPGGVGHGNIMAQFYAERAKPLADAIEDPQVKRQALARIDEYSVRLSDQEHAWEQGRRIEKYTNDTKTQWELGTNRVMTTPRPDVLADELDDLDASIDALSVNDDLKGALRQEGRRSIVNGYIRKLSETAPEQARVLLASGAFDSELSPSQLDAAGQNVQAELRRQAAERERAAAAAKAEARSSIDVFQKQLADGVPVSDEDLQKMGEVAAANGLDGEVYDLAKARVINGLNKELRTASPTEIDAKIKTLDARIAQAGEKAEPADVIALNHLRARLPAASAALRNDPLSLWAARGGSIAPVNWSDPASIDARIRTAQTAARALGVPVRYFSPAEAEAMTLQYQGGEAGRLEVANQIARMGPAAGLQAAKQIASEDVVLARAVTLPQAYRALIFSGQKAMGANGKLVPVAETQEQFNALAGRSMMGVGAEFNAATVQTARQIAAGLMARDGASELTPDTWDWAVHMALGGDASGGVRQGGIGEHNGRKMLLPSQMSQSDFDRRFARVANFVGALGADGKQASSAWIKANATPVMVRDGQYTLELPNGTALMNARGGRYTFDIRQQP